MANNHSNGSRQDSWMVLQICDSSRLKHTIHLFLDPSRLNQALIRPVQSGLVINDIFPKNTNVHHLTLIDTSLEYHNLKLGNKSSCLTTFACQFGRYRYTRQPIAVAQAGNIPQQNRDIQGSVQHISHYEWYFDCGL